MEDANNSPVKLVSLLNLAMSSCRSVVAVALEDCQLGAPAGLVVTGAPAGSVVTGIPSLF
jgi:hypothetical protein